MTEVFDGIKKNRHPEEAAQRLSRRTHNNYPAAQQASVAKPALVRSASQP
jgi:hypothetical protein